MKKTLILAGVVLLAAAMRPELAVQSQPVPSAEAEERFQVALEAFESGDYNYASQFFRDVYRQVPAHTKTTAAYLMAGKSLHRLGDHEAAIALMEEFLAGYPTSGYQEAAFRLIVAAQQTLRDVQRDAEALQVGVALPLSPDRLEVTRSMFRGILLAVDAYNLQSEQRVKLVFRDTGNTDESARSAVESLLDGDVSVIIGPLSSSSVHAVASMIEERQAVLIAPLATDVSLTEGRRYIFQVNATSGERGHAIARHAVEYLPRTEIGIVTEAGDHASQSMAQGFTAELQEHGLEPSFTYEVQSSADWSNLPQLIGRDKFSATGGIFFSVRNSSHVQDGINGIHRAGLRPYILGPSKWPSINLRRLGREIAVYTVDPYHWNDRRRHVRGFVRDYRDSNRDTVPDSYARTGYDVAEMLLQNLGTGGSLRSSLRFAPLYEGVTMRIQFGADQRNTALYLFEYTPDGPQMIR